MYIVRPIQSVKLAFLLVLLLALYSCTPQQSTNTPDSPEKSGNSLLINDTVYQTYKAFETELNWKKLSKDTLIEINDKKFTLSWSAIADSLKPLSYSYTYTKEGKPHKDIYLGYDIRYEINLRNENQQSVFSKIFTKPFFYQTLDTGLVIVSQPHLPKFLGFQKKFNAFLFTVNFWLPNSDIGEECFFMTDFKGKITENFVSHVFGGGGCDGEITIPASQDFILTCQKILYPNGKFIALEDENFRQICVNLINDTTILVIREYDAEKNPENAVLINNLGMPIKTFRYQGYVTMLEYSVPLHFDKLTHRFYLLDKDAMRIIDKLKPADTYAVEFEKLEKVIGNPKETEVAFELSSVMFSGIFYVDKNTFAIRIKKRIENE
jgi:hypothetical protein